ncbi:Uroporphyrinogen-III C-methyltransferase [Thiomonas sp. X19]|uniref:uroporphyrinogen-III C-methyltransferase n=1 Tax=Thiomonas sp. X19 TaxID=1050370 RepID=UPI000B6EEE8E|nr:uroporphyrinogen-III C-methyltransferase [Thiomonas sp. X19]SCC95490.1 Uroporphyrinogen-III C-methyltransferase [Thiomonas sp. X19]
MPHAPAAASTRPSTRTAPAVHLVGAGPGDPELLTLKAVRVLQQASVALVDDLVDEGCLQHLPPSCRVVHVGKRGGCASTPQAFIERLMVAEALRGERVVRLKGGDPLLFGRAGEEIAALRAAGIAVEVVPGITAGVAAAAASAVSLTHRDHARGVAFVTGHAAAGNGVDWAALARSGLTLVVYMGVSTAAAIQQALLDGGLPASTPALLVQSASALDERRLRTRLSWLAESLAASGLASPCVMIIGEVTEAKMQTQMQADAPSWARPGLQPGLRPASQAA